jgi:hypothetical protein
VDFSKLSARVESVGIGGTSRLFFEPSVLLTFSDDRSLFVYRLGIQVAGPGQVRQDVPSLLGRDVLRHWRSRFDPGRDRLSFLVNFADATFALDD